MPRRPSAPLPAGRCGGCYCVQRLHLLGDLHPKPRDLPQQNAARVVVWTPQLCWSPADICSQVCTVAVPALATATGIVLAVVPPVPS